jgi:hypothetical protein
VTPLRSTVAVVEARPETVGEDYRRLLSLAGLDEAGPELRLLADAARPGGGRQGPASPAWQMSGLLGAGRGPAVVHALDGAGRSAAADAAWSTALAATGSTLADAGDRERHRVSGEGLPALAECLSDGPRWPRGLAGSTLLLASGLAVGDGWPVAGGLELLTRLVAPPYLRRRRHRATAAEAVADALALARAECVPAGAVIDAVRWHVQAGRWRRRTLLGNILLAGRDPVAVDAVACRLGGVDPARVPWLRLCAERGLGRIDPQRIDVVGQADLLAPGLDLPGHLLEPAAGGAWPGGTGGGKWPARLLARGAAPLASGWDALVNGAVQVPKEKA